MVISVSSVEVEAIILGHFRASYVHVEILIYTVAQLAISPYECHTKWDGSIVIIVEDV